LKKTNVSIFKFVLGKELFEGLYFPSFIKDWDLNIINFLMIERFLSYILYNKSSNALFFYDGKANYLEVEKFKHSTVLEYVYGIFPSIIIALILLPSLYLLYSTDEDVDPSYTIKVIGHQWFWSYEYNGISYNVDNFLLEKDKGRGLMTFENYKINYDSVIIAEENLKEGYKRLLETDNVVLIPCQKAIRFVITSGDVLHSWAVPSLGIKTDAVPGRLNQVITMVCKPGVYYGQCSELCGVSHGFMPIVIFSTSERKFFAMSVWREYITRSPLGLLALQHFIKQEDSVNICPIK
jgi:cytochrome c oxidase subunit 2